MALPAIAAGLAAGALSGLFGAGAARKTRRQQLRAIEAAFKISRERQGQGQQDIRQSSAEGLNARGILTGGSGGAVPAAPVPQVGGTQPAGTFGRPVQDPRVTNANASAKRAYEIALSSARGTVGPANTLAGQAQRDLSREFELEQKDLDAQETAARSGVNAEYSQRMAGVLSGAIGTAFGVGNLVNSFKAPTLPPPPPVLSNPNPLNLPDKIQGAFGLDPVNPLGGLGSVNKFNVFEGRR